MRALVILALGLAALTACSPSFRIGAYSTLMRDDRPIAPFEIAPDLFYVGSSGIAVYALRTSDGLIVINGGYEATGRRVLENLRTLGLDPAQVRILLNTHAHMDHAAGLAAIKRATGATLYAHPRDGAVLAAGGRDDPTLGDLMPYPAVTADLPLEASQVVTLGERALTARFTPGHTPGCTSWSFTLTVDGEDRDVLILCSMAALFFYRLEDNDQYPEIASDFERSFALLEDIPCELFLADHGKFFGLAAKRRALENDPATNPFIDPDGCRAYLEDEEERFRRRAGLPPS